MKKNGRYIRNIIILVCVCAALAAAYFLITAHEDPATAGVLYKLGNDKITQVAIDNQYGSFLFEQQDGAWIVESGGIYRTNPEKMDLLFASLEEFEITRMLEEEKNEYGFDVPQAEVSVSTKGGKKYSFVVGNEAIAGSSVYIKSNGQIMLTSTAMTAQLTGSLAAYRAKDVLMVDTANIRSIEYYAEGEKTLSVTNTDYKNWSMIYPFEVPARKVVMNELVSNLSSLTIAGYVDSENINEETGLSEPVGKMVLTDEAGVQQTLEFGAVSDTLQYVSIGTENDIVKLYVADLDFSELTPEGVMYIAPLDADVSQVQSMSVQTGGTTDTITLEYNSEDVTAKLNGAEIPYSSTFVSIYFKWITLNADGYDTEPITPGECEAVCTMTMLSGETIELSLYQRDADTLYMYVNGQMLMEGQTKFYMDRSSLTELLYRVQSANGN
jgi:hypothetical protein